MPPNSSNPNNPQHPLIKALTDLGHRLEPSKVKIMEVCGTHTVTAQQVGLHSLLPENIRLISGPGCPVCVTPAGYIDQAVYLATEHNVHISSYGDMLRVPGVKSSLEDARRRGAQISVIYTVNEALNTARQNPDQTTVFLGIGFETTTPPTAYALQTAKKEGLTNFKVLAAHKTIIPAMEALLTDSELSIDGFLAPGHVSVIIGSNAYNFIAEKHLRPCVVTGFDGEQMMMGIVRILMQLVENQPKIENVYPSRVTTTGNQHAQKIIADTFTPADSAWRGLGVIPLSGMKIRPEFAQFDAHQAFNLDEPDDHEPSGCRCADVLKGMILPNECPLFAKTCTPTTPVGACMVSREGSCSVYYKYAKAGVPT